MASWRARALRALARWLERAASAICGPGGCGGCLQDSGEFAVSSRVLESIDQQTPQRRRSAVDILSLLRRPGPPRSVGGSYRFTAHLGDGAFSSVFLAESTSTGENFAIKCIQKPDSREKMNFLCAELETMLSLDHPNIAKFHEYLEDQHTLRLVTEWCTEGDYSQLSRHCDSLQEIRRLFRDVVKAVAYCHDHGVVHRDLKFENCLIQREPQQPRTGKVIDFGLAAIRRPGDPSGPWLSEQLGTHYFIAPEVISSGRQYGAKCDCWSLGVMLYVLLTDEHPFAADAQSLDTAQLFRKVLQNAVRVQPLEGTVEDSARDLLLQLLQKDPERRLDSRSVLFHEWLGAPKVDTEQQSSSRHCSDRRQSQPSSFGSSFGSAPGSFGSPVPLDEHLTSRIRSFGALSRFERTVLTLAAHHASAKDVASLQATFFQLDSSRDGSLSGDELRAAIDRSGREISEEDFAELFRSLDADGDGKVNYTDWLAATMRPSLVASSTAVAYVWSFFDREGDGQVDGEKLQRVLGRNRAFSGVLRSHEAGGDCFFNKLQFGDLMRDVADAVEKRASGQAR